MPWDSIRVAMNRARSRVRISKGMNVRVPMYFYFNNQCTNKGFLKGVYFNQGTSK
jgi:hypothetical protein